MRFPLWNKWICLCTFILRAVDSKETCRKRETQGVNLHCARVYGCSTASSQSHELKHLKSALTPANKTSALSSNYFIIIFLSYRTWLNYQSGVGTRRQPWNLPSHIGRKTLPQENGSRVPLSVKSSGNKKILCLSSPLSVFPSLTFPSRCVAQNKDVKCRAIIHPLKEGAFLWFPWKRD